MSARAKLFKNGGSQAVRLPKECRFPADLEEVLVHREGKRIVLEAADAWPPEFLACIGAWQNDLPRPKPESIRTLEDPFR
jgi:antitoxin VapB